MKPIYVSPSRQKQLKSSSNTWSWPSAKGLLCIEMIIAFKMAHSQMSGWEWESNQFLFEFVFIFNNETKTHFVICKC